MKVTVSTIYAELLFYGSKESTREMFCICRQPIIEAFKMSLIKSTESLRWAI